MIHIRSPNLVKLLSNLLTFPLLLIRCHSVSSLCLIKNYNEQFRHIWVCLTRVQVGSCICLLALSIVDSLCYCILALRL